jgi:alanyl-tRNA synthetase
LRPSDPGVVVLASAQDGGGVAFVAAVNDAGRAAGLSAGDLVKQFAPALGARGGGKPDLAQGAGGDAAKLDAAFAAVKAVLSAR